MQMNANELGRLTIEIIEGRNLPACDSNGKSDPYCVIDICGKHKKTKIQRKTLSPIWNETFEFEVDRDTKQFIVHVYDWDFWTTDDYMGKVIVNLDSICNIKKIDKWYPLTNKKDKSKATGELHIKFSILIEKKSVGAKKSFFGRRASSRGEVARSQLRSQSTLLPVDEDYIELLTLIRNDDFDGLLDFLLRDEISTVINKTDKNGYTALHHACAAKELVNQDRIVLRLLEVEGIDVKCETAFDKNTPLHYFCHYFRSPDIEDLLKQFIHHGADVNARNGNGETPLFKAIFNDSIRLLLVEYLLGAGADVNILNTLGEGVLHYAVRLQRSDLVGALLKAGAELNVRGTRSNQTPHDLALQDNNQIVADQIQKAKDLADFLEKHKFTQYKQKIFAHLEEPTLDNLHEINEDALDKLGITSTMDRTSILVACKSAKVTPASPAGESLLSSSPPKDLFDTNSDIAKIVNELKAVDTGNTDWVINSQDLEFLKKLGAGTSGDVYKGLYKGKHVAIKLLKEMTAEKEIAEFKKEFSIMRAVRSPYVVYFFGACLQPKLCMVMEFCARGSLFHVLSDPVLNFTWDKFFHLAIETSMALTVLHGWEPQIMHRDLKSLNLLVTKDWHVKVCDFGLSRFDTAENIQTMCKMRGTMAFCAPEVYRGKKFTPKSDVYSMGIVLWEMVVRVIRQQYEQPYSEYTHLMFDFQIIIQAATKNLRPTLPPTTPKALQELITKCLAGEAEPRPTSKDLMEKLKDCRSEYEANKEEWNSAICPKPANSEQPNQMQLNSEPNLLEE